MTMWEVPEEYAQSGLPSAFDFVIGGTGQGVEGLPGAGPGSRTLQSAEGGIHIEPR